MLKICKSRNITQLKKRPDIALHAVKRLAKFFEKIEGANIETNVKEARKIFEKTELASDENIISLDVKSLPTIVPLEQPIDIALRKLYEQRYIQTLHTLL